MDGRFNNTVYCEWEIGGTPAGEQPRLCNRHGWHLAAGRRLCTQHLNIWFKRGGLAAMLSQQSLTEGTTEAE